MTNDQRAFTDDNLKRLKEKSEDRWYPPNQMATVTFQVDTLKALLARLEAAEKACLLAEELGIRADEIDRAEDLQIALLFWREAARR